MQLMKLMCFEFKKKDLDNLDMESRRINFCGQLLPGKGLCNLFLAEISRSWAFGLISSHAPPFFWMSVKKFRYFLRHYAMKWTCIIENMMVSWLSVLVGGFILLSFYVSVYLYLDNELCIRLVYEFFNGILNDLDSGKFCSLK